MQKPRTNYITNKDLLAEIAKSKRTYCSYERPEHAVYDVIVPNTDAITPQLLAQIQTSRLTAKVAPVCDEVVFRVMTDEHIPAEGMRKRRAKGATNTDRVNFPPFKHYVLRDNTLHEVGRSHWIGSISNGHFNVDHGRTSNALAKMLMLLVERYSKRGNWRGYCVDFSTEALTQRGWLRHDEITTDDLILSYDGNTLRWSSIKSIFRDQYDGLMFRMTVSGLDALVTPGHKFVTDEGVLCPVEYLREKDRLLLMADGVPDPDGVPQYEDAFVEIVGWAATEGCFHLREDCASERLTIYQNEGPKADRIRGSLKALGARFNENSRIRPELYRVKTPKANVSFNLDAETSRRVRAVLGTDKSLTMPFLLALTQQQRMLLIETMVDADGFRHAPHLLRYLQKSSIHTDSFEALCTMAGLRLTTKERDIVSYGKPTTIRQVTLFGPRNSRWAAVENIDMHGAKRNGKRKGIGKVTHPNEPTVPYKGVVWCPETEFGTFVARRNGTIYITSNTYVDEMKGHALLQLSQIALQFDESKSDNPFAFYTTVIRNCFTRVLNLEKKNQHIRDDLLIMAGARPSFTRQIEDEMEQRAAASMPVVPAVDGGAVIRSEEE